MSEEESSVAEPLSIPQPEPTAPVREEPVQVQNTPYAVFPDADSFQKRVEREARKHLKDIGISDPSQVRDALNEYSELKKAAQEAERAKMSEIERLNADLATAKQAQNDAEEAYTQMEVRTHLAGVFAQHGIRNYDYAYFIVEQKLDSMEDGEELDENAFIEELCQDPASRAALGFSPDGSDSPPPARPVTTSPALEGAPSPVQNNGQAMAKTAMDMSAEEWAQHKSSLGLT